MFVYRGPSFCRLEESEEREAAMQDLKNAKQELFFSLLPLPLFIFIVVVIFSLTSFPFILYQGDMLSQIC